LLSRGLPKNKALIKFLSEEGIKQLLQKTWIRIYGRSCFVQNQNSRLWKKGS
jgi:hypothetical protein